MNAHICQYGVKMNVHTFAETSQNENESGLYEAFLAVMTP
jgi:hypothetical protein